MSRFSVNEIACANVFDLAFYRPSSDDPYVYYDPIMRPRPYWSADDRCTSSNAIRFHKSALFSKDDFSMPKIEYVTIGFARNMKPTDVITVLEVNGGRRGEEALDKFGPGTPGRQYNSHFREGTVLTDQMADADVDDDEVFSWSGSCREYVKVTKELLAWSVPISERMKELVTPRWINHYEKDIRTPAEKTRMLVEPKTLELLDKIKALEDELIELHNRAEQQEKRGAEIMLAEMDREAKRARV